MDKQQDKTRKYSCSGNLGIYVYLCGIKDKTPEEVAALFHEKAEEVRAFAAKVFDEAEEEAEVDEMWDAETLEYVDEKDYYETE